jgi:hypothetical protein
MGRIHGSWKQGMEVRMSLLTVLHDPLGEVLLPIHRTLGFSGLEVPKEGILLPGDTAKIALNYKLLLLVALWILYV